MDWGLAHRSLGPISAIGVYEIQYAKGHKYLTLVYQIDSASTRLLWIGQERTVEAFQGFFAMLGTELSSHIQFVCSDIWKPYLRVVRDKCSQALHILDRFHIFAKMNEALDDVRAAESRKMAQDGYEPLLQVPLLHPQAQSQSHFATEVPATRSAPLQPANRSCLFAQRRLPALLGLQLSYLGWSVSRLLDSANHALSFDPMKKIAKTLRVHRELILNYFKAKKQFSSGVVEGLNNKVKVTMRKSYGFRTFRITELALYHALGKLPEPELTHEFF